MFADIIASTENHGGTPAPNAAPNTAVTVAATSAVSSANTTQQGTTSKQTINAAADYRQVQEHQRSIPG
jgi:hypothetical protein